MESRVDGIRARRALKNRHRWRPAILPYGALVRPGRVYLTGRAFRHLPPRPTAYSGQWQRVVGMIGRVLTREIPHSDVELSAGLSGPHAASASISTATIATDEEGIFGHSFAVDEGSDATPESTATPDGTGSSGSDLTLSARLIDPVVSEPALYADDRRSLAHVDSRFVLISDLDDTVVKMKILGMRRLLSTVIFADAERRQTFAGVPEFYGALRTGSGGSPNPVAYVSSSPWNVHDLVEDFLALQDMPPGAVFLRDWGISASEFLPTRHAQYKLRSIRRILDFFAPLPVILSGDDGQEDPEIYAGVAREFPGRIAVIYIRTLAPGERAARARVEALQTALQGTGTALVATDSAAEMLRDARQRGFAASASEAPAP